MKKARMISVIAASLLTATVVFTGCGGGGSSTCTTCSSSSSEATSSSSSVQPTVKVVKVSDGYVLAATVKCKDAQGNEVAGPAAATNNPGEYELSLTSECPILCARDGYIDVNANGQLDNGEPKAPKMTAPGTYSNINPYTTLIQHGAEVSKLISAFDLPADTNFDVAIPEASDAVRIKAIELSVYLSYLQNKQNATTKACLPGQPCDEGSSESSETSESSSETTNNIASLADFVAALNAGKSFNELIPEDIQPIINEIENATSPEEAEQKASTFLATTNGCYGECESSSSSEVSSSSESSNEESSSSSEASDNSGGAFPDLGGNTSSSSSSSEESSSSSEASDNSGGAFPDLGGNTSSSSSSSEESSSSSEASSTSSSSSETGNGSNDAFPNLK